jgi:hypothetical protein
MQGIAQRQVVGARTFSKFWIFAFLGIGIVCLHCGFVLAGIDATR